MSRNDPNRLEVSLQEARDAFATLDRRAFLRLVGGATALALPTGCGGVPEQHHPPAGLELRQFSVRNYATFTAAAKRLVGPKAAAFIDNGQLDAALAADRWADREPGLGGPVSLALSVLEFGIHPLVPKWRPFSRLPVDGQDEVLRLLMSSRFDVAKDIFRGVRSLVMVTVYGHPLGVKLTGHPGPFGGPEVGIADAMTYELDF